MVALLGVQAIGGDRNCALVFGVFLLLFTGSTIASSRSSTGFILLISDFKRACGIFRVCLYLKEGVGASVDPHQNL